MSNTVLDYDRIPIRLAFCRKAYLFIPPELTEEDKETIKKYVDIQLAEGLKVPQEVLDV